MEETTVEDKEMNDSNKINGVCRDCFYFITERVGYGFDLIKTGGWCMYNNGVDLTPVRIVDSNLEKICFVEYKR